MDPTGELCIFIVVPGVLIGGIFGVLTSNLVIRKKRNLVFYFIIILSVGILISFMLNPMIIFTAGLFLLIFLFRSNEGATKEFAPVEWVTSGYVKRLDKTEEDNKPVVSGTLVNLLTIIIFFLVSMIYMLLFPFGLKVI